MPAHSGPVSASSLGATRPQQRPQQRPQPHFDAAFPRAHPLLRLLGSSAGTVLRTVPGMSTSYGLHLTVDAAGTDGFRVRRRDVWPIVGPAGVERPRGHLAVRVGPLLAYCLDGRSVTDLAAAWAQAMASTARLLPPRAAPPQQPVPPGIAAPAAETVLEGPQRWHVAVPHVGQPHATVSTSWLTVRVHDVAALTVHTTAWAQAAALGRSVFQTPPVPFNALLEQARFRDLAQDLPAERTREARPRTR